MIVKENVTGSKSFDHIRKQLNIGISLSYFINKLPIECGKVFSFVPAETAEENLYNFESGGIYPFDKNQLKITNLIPVRNDSNVNVLDEIKAFVRKDESNCCLFEHSGASPQFPWVRSSGIEHVYLNDEMFFYFDNSNYDVEKLSESFDISNTYLLLCALSCLSLEERSYFKSFNEITTASLELFVKNMSAFIVNAYDGEGYLMWIK